MTEESEVQHEVRFNVEALAREDADGRVEVPPERWDAQALYDANPDRLPGGAERLGRYVAQVQAMGLLNLRSANRAVQGIALPRDLKLPLARAHAVPRAAAAGLSRTAAIQPQLLVLTLLSAPT